MSVALRLARRELRGGLASFRIFLACLALGVAAIAAVGSIRAAVQSGLASEATSILGGDASARFTYRFANDAEREWMASVATDVSEIVDFRSLAAVERNGEIDRTLVQVKAIDAFYPLYGTAEFTPAFDFNAPSAATDLPAAAVEQALADRLDLSVGDNFELGQTTFTLAAILTREPDAVAGGFSLGPKVIVRTVDLDGSGLIAPGTLYNTSYRMKLPTGTDLDAIKADALDRFRDAGLRWRDSRNAAPGIARFVDRIGSFLVLVGLAGLAVGGIGVSAAVGAYIGRKTETIATLKTLGASSRTIFSVYMIQIAALSTLGIAIGLALGAGLPMVLGPLINDSLPVPAAFGFYAKPTLEAALYGYLVALIFALWPLARARNIKAANLFRDISGTSTRWPSGGFIALIAGLVVALIGAAAVLSDVPQLTLWAAFGVLSALAVLGLAALGTKRLARRLAPSGLSNGRPSLRLALSSVGNAGSEANAVILSLGLGLTVLAALGQVNSNMRSILTGDLPEIAPTYFVVDIRNEQLPAFLEDTKTQDGVSDIETAAMLRGIITGINGKDATEVAGEHWVLRGDRGLSYGDTPPDGAELTEGTWWEEGYSGPPLVSFAAEEGEELGLKIGDTITVNILGREMDFRIANFRVVDFGTMGINFIMITNSAALQGAPHSHIATVYAEEADPRVLLRSMTKGFPNITAVATKDAIERVTATLNSLASATSWGAGINLLTGFIVLIGAAAAGERNRTYEAAILKTLGATRARVLSSFALRSAIMGAAAGFVALFAGSIAAWAVITFVMDADFVLAPGSALLIVTGGALASIIAGLLFSLRATSAKPAQILRAND